MKLESKTLKVRDVARQLDVHANTVRRYVAEGRIKSYRLGNRGDFRFLQADIDAFIARCQTCEVATECPFKTYFQLK
jgi:excisionase family DNA binding protein